MRLPNRRDSRIIDFEHRGMNFSAGYSYFPNTTDLAECFIHPEVVTGDLHEDCASISAITSIALQRGAPLAEIRATLPKHPNGKACCIMGAALAAIAKAAEAEAKEFTVLALHAPKLRPVYHA